MGCSYKRKTSVTATNSYKYCVMDICYYSDLNGKGIAGTFLRKRIATKQTKKNRIEKVIKRKGNKLYVKWKGYDNSFNSWVDKKDVV